MPIKILNKVSTSSTADTAVLTTRLDDLSELVPSPAGTGNTSKFVYEEINGIIYRAIAIEGNESLEMKLSTLGSQSHWRLEEHGLDTQLNLDAAHLYHEGMKIVIDSISGAGSKHYRVKANPTVAQLLTNPTDPDVLPVDTAYERWAYE